METYIVIRDTHGNGKPTVRCVVAASRADAVLYVGGGLAVEPGRAMEMVAAIAELVVPELDDHAAERAGKE